MHAYSPSVLESVWSDPVGIVIMILHTAGVDATATDAAGPSARHGRVLTIIIIYFMTGTVLRSQTSAPHRTARDCVTQCTALYGLRRGRDRRPYGHTKTRRKHTPAAVVYLHLICSRPTAQHAHAHTHMRSNARAHTRLLISRRPTGRQCGPAHGIRRVRNNRARLTTPRPLTPVIPSKQCARGSARHGPAVPGPMPRGRAATRPEAGTRRRRARGPSPSRGGA